MYNFFATVQNNTYVVHKIIGLIKSSILDSRLPEFIHSFFPDDVQPFPKLSLHKNINAY